MMTLLFCQLRLYVLVFVLITISLHALLYLQACNNNDQGSKVNRGTNYRYGRGDQMVLQSADAGPREPSFVLQVV